MAADAESFRLLEPSLARSFTVVSVDRRGRYDSPDDEVYDIAAEFDDLVGVVESLPEPAVVFGHSFGANVALGAALQTPKIAKLVLYEPGRRGDASAALRAELEQLLERGERREAMRLVLLEFTRFPEEWIDDLLDTPPWQERLAYAHTMARELRAYEEHDYGDLSRLRTPTLFLVGGESPATELDHARELAGVLPSAHVSVLDGQGHVAPVTAPELVAREIAAFAAEGR
ncbi:MAG TPA: alpha/beta hydrolase, partial [Galbitalea sp.]|nr:alpha/beta hydrolase [Galbitalea sp.]